jgi:hypothetical protein
MREPSPRWEKIAEPSRPLAALKAGDLKSALAGFATCHVLEYRTLNDRLRRQFYSDSDLSGFGAVLWLMGDQLGAANVWSFATEEALEGHFRYSNTGTFQPGLLLWFASVWLKDEDWHDQAAALFEKLLRRKVPLMSGHFQILLAKLLRREITFEELRVAYTDMRPQERDGAERQALFYAGVRAYEEGKVEETRRLWSQVPAYTDRDGELEYYLLMHERKKLGKRG